MREKLSSAMTSSNLQQSEFDCAIDKIHALGIASIGGSVGSDFIHFADGLQPKSYNQLIAGLVKSASKKFKCEKAMMAKLCRIVIHEHVFRFCFDCGGSKEIREEERIIAQCPTCAGTGLHSHKDSDRASALGLTAEDFLKGWNNRLKNVEVLFSEKLLNTIRLASRKYYD